LSYGGVYRDILIDPEGLVNCQATVQSLVCAGERRGL